MPIRFETPEFKKALVDLAINLAHAPDELTSPILADPDIQGAVSAEAMQATLHYVKGLLDYGFSLDDDIQSGALKKALSWFSADFSTQQNSQVDAIEMYRLEGTLLLRQRRADKLTPIIRARLAQLVKQRTPDGTRFEIQDPPRHPSDTLWALKVLHLAHKYNALTPDLMKPESLREIMDASIRLDALDTSRELALALRLRFDLFGELTKAQHSMLREHFCQPDFAGMWDLRQNLTWVADRLRTRELSQQDIDANYGAFWSAVQSTCIVVENLAGLIELYTELHSTLLRAVEMWLNLFYADDHADAISPLRAIFTNRPTDCATAMALTLSALRAFLGEPLIHYTAAYTHNQMFDFHSDRDLSSEKHHIEQALRKSLKIELGRMEKLNLGLSGAIVVRFHPVIRNPIDLDRWIFTEPLVVKYGPVDEINLERENCNKLPPVLRNVFVNIPPETYFDHDRRQAYIIMPDLTHYETLYEMLRENRNVSPRIWQMLKSDLGAFLVGMHKADNHTPRPAQRGALYELYFQPMHLHLGIIFNMLWDDDRRLVVNDPEQRQIANGLHQKLTDQLAVLARLQDRLGNFPRAYMHGDLHTRNIMIRRPNDGGPAGLGLKLIDLEKVRADGDAALDLGMLLTDVNVLKGDGHWSSGYTTLLQEIMQKLGEAYLQFARQRSDETFDMRVQLAMARSYIRVAKGKTRQIEQHLRSGRRGEAIEFARRMLGHCEQAAKCMQKVLDAFEAVS